MLKVASSAVASETGIAGMRVPAEPLRRDRQNVSDTQVIGTQITGRSSSLLIYVSFRFALSFEDTVCEARHNDRWLVGGRASSKTELAT
ncbi:hypothetical protein OPQ81_001768 [Rhizoctonia solani]|nr:hypothetical protein OPQ81_001768 [Rhizoctonia solani]